jgi:GSH-dependent disulfide-bond oxidoreductase
MVGRAAKSSRQATVRDARTTRAAAGPGASPNRKRASAKKSIDLYYWPTPNGWKITIMLEECGLPYSMIPVNISKGEQFKPEFLAISPNNRMPAIVDHDGPGSKPISVFESGAILQYLGRKTGKFYPKAERGRVEVEQWLFWQMANLGPKAGEANHFRNYAPEKLPYAIDRFANEMHRIYGVMNTRLSDREFIAGKYSIADMACIGWASRAERFGHDLSEFPNVRRWRDAVMARPAVKRGLSVKVEAAFRVDMTDPNVRAVLFNQRARTGSR